MKDHRPLASLLTAAGPPPSFSAQTMVTEAPGTAFPAGSRITPLARPPPRQPWAWTEEAVQSATSSTIGNDTRAGVLGCIRAPERRATIAARPISQGITRIRPRMCGAPKKRGGADAPPLEVVETELEAQAHVEADRARLLEGHIVLEVRVDGTGLFVTLLVDLGSRVEVEQVEDIRAEGQRQPLVEVDVVLRGEVELRDVVGAAEAATGQELELTVERLVAVLVGEPVGVNAEAVDRPSITVTDAGAEPEVDRELVGAEDAGVVAAV